MKHKFTVGVLLLALSGSALLLSGCAGTTALSPTLPPLSASEMVGVWKGTMTWAGQGGPPFDTRIALQQDGTISGSSTLGGALSGTWSVSGANYTDSISITTRMLTFTRSGAMSGKNISGSFSAVGGGMGKFTMTKEQ
jgi:hypothetical protein